MPFEAVYSLRDHLLGRRNHLACGLTIVNIFIQKGSQFKMNISTVIKLGLTNTKQQNIKITGHLIIFKFQKNNKLFLLQVCPHITHDIFTVKYA